MKLNLLQNLEKKKNELLLFEAKTKALLAEKTYLEIKFRKALDEGQVEIQKLIDQAQQCLDAAVELSEEKGIPFSSQIVNLGRFRFYKPKSFNAVWKEMSSNIMLDVLLSSGMNHNSESGWQYWSTSSLDC